MIWDAILLSLHQVFSSSFSPSLCKGAGFLFRSGFLSTFHSAFSEVLGFALWERFCSGKTTVITDILQRSKLPEILLSLFLMDTNSYFDLNCHTKPNSFVQCVKISSDFPICFHLELSKREAAIMKSTENSLRVSKN